MHGDYLLPYLNKFLTLLAPTPTYSSINDEADTLINPTPASSATAFPSEVFPVPGGPDNKIPFGILAPNFVNFSGYFKKSTISISSSLASSIPAI
jgi:hypothetical protein